MRLSENCSRVHLIVPLVARASYFIYAGLAITAYREAEKIFDESNFSEGCLEPGGACRMPIRFCSPESVDATIDVIDGDALSPPSALTELTPVAIAAGRELTDASVRQMIRRQKTKAS